MSDNSRGSTAFPSLRGQLLIAESELGDPNFSETVVLLINHDEEGAFGLVVNRRSRVSLGEAAPAYAESPLAGLPLYVGGPVDQEYLFTLHAGLPPEFMSPHALLICEGVYFEPSFSHLEEFLTTQTHLSPPEFRLVAGYSGWSPGQLEAELAEKAWVTLPAEAGLVFNPHPAKGWKDALRRKGGVYWVVAETGSKPSLN